jgi:hypothetical protein
MRTARVESEWASPAGGSSNAHAGALPDDVLSIVEEFSQHLEKSSCSAVGIATSAAQKLHARAQILTRQAHQ